MRKIMSALFIFVAIFFPLVLSSCAIITTSFPVDSDKDIVFDNYDYRNDFTTPPYYDKCPTSTPMGVKVDDWGCAIDSDKDGVPDYLDKCPGTPAGVKVDKDGCPTVEKLHEVRAEAPATVATVVTSEPKKEAAVVVAMSEPKKEAASVVAMSEPKKEAAAAAVVAKEIFEKGRVSINVKFDFNKADIKPKFHKEIQKLADVMKNYPDLKVVIEGHTDNVGDKVINEKLSAKRANSVKNYLTKKCGIYESRLEAKGYGMSKPIDSNKTKAGRQKNRRVEAAVAYTIKK